MKKEYTFAYDPGHGWLVVPYKDIKHVGCEDKISMYSYVIQGNVWLEEDCDAPMYMEEAKKIGWEVKVGAEQEINFIIRDYQRWDLQWFRDKVYKGEIA